MVIEGGEPRPEGHAGEIVLDEAVDVDDGDAVDQLDASHQYENQRDHRVHRLEHLALASFPWSRH